MRRVIILLLILSLFTATAYAEIYNDYKTVYETQATLNDAGYSCGVPNGNIDKNTKSAMP